MMFWYGWHMSYWQAGLMWAGMIVFLGLLIWGAYLVITSLAPRTRTSDKDSDSMRILDARLARGEIDAEEYRGIRGLINGAPTEGEDQRSDHGARR